MLRRAASHGTRRMVGGPAEAQDAPATGVKTLAPLERSADRHLGAGNARRRLPVYHRHARDRSGDQLSSRRRGSQGHIDRLRFAFASCSYWELGYFSAYRHMLRGAPDLVLFLGDYIYEYTVPEGLWSGAAVGVLLQSSSLWAIFNLAARKHVGLMRTAATGARDAMPGGPSARSCAPMFIARPTLTPAAPHFVHRRHSVCPSLPRAPPPRRPSHGPSRIVASRARAFLRRAACVGSPPLGGRSHRSWRGQPRSLLDRHPRRVIKDDQRIRG